jgi:hypothetical protein
VRDAPPEKIIWRKSSRSVGNGGDRVELDHAGLVRDSKNPATRLAVDLGGLLAAVKADRSRR